jgi:hypothetical protein
MSYRSGIGNALALLLNQPALPPHFICDSCGTVANVTPKARPGLPYKWFTDGKAPPRWKKEDGCDICPGCHEQEATP